MHDEHANIMILGRTGMGKSSFINYLLDEDVCKTGIGAPITQGFDVYEYDRVKNGDSLGLPLRIYDSKGLEVLDYSGIKQDIIAFVKKQRKNEDVYQWIHSIFYCVNVTGNRFEPEEASFIKALSNEVAQTVHIILTHCKQTPEGLQQSEGMEKRIKSQLEDARIRVYCVNSVASQTRKGVFPAFGREEVLNQIVELLWADICYRVSKKYVKEMHATLIKYVDVVQRYDDVIWKKFDITNALKMDEETELSSEISALHQDFSEQTKKNFIAMMRPLVKFCNQYGARIDEEIKYSDPLYEFNWLPSLEFWEDSEIRDNTKFGRFQQEIDELLVDIEYMTTTRAMLEALKAIGKSLLILIRIKNTLKNISMPKTRKYILRFQTSRLSKTMSTPN